MSVYLESKDGNYGEGVSNGTWAAIVALARAFDKSVPEWNGCHDGQEWTQEHLTVMANRLEQTAKSISMLRVLARHGGVVIS